MTLPHLSAEILHDIFSLTLANPAIRIQGTTTNEQGECQLAYEDVIATISNVEEYITFKTLRNTDFAPHSSAVFPLWILPNATWQLTLPTVRTAQHVRQTLAYLQPALRTGAAMRRLDLVLQGNELMLDWVAQEPSNFRVTWPSA